MSRQCKFFKTDKNIILKRNNFYKNLISLIKNASETKSLRNE